MTVSGVKSISSRSTLSFARIFLEFEVGYDMDEALVDIKQAVEETKYELPREAEDLKISEYSEASFPVMNISIIGNSSIRQKVFYAKELKDKVESLEEILQANLSGAPEEVLEGVINKSRMESYEVTLSDIYYSVSNNNLIIPEVHKILVKVVLISKCLALLKLLKMFTLFRLKLPKMP